MLFPRGFSFNYEFSIQSQNRERKWIIKTKKGKERKQEEILERVNEIIRYVKCIVLLYLPIDPMTIIFGSQWTNTIMGPAYTDPCICIVKD